MVDTENDSSKGELISHNKDASTIKLSNYESYFNSGSADKTIKLWIINPKKKFVLFPH